MEAFKLMAGGAIFGCIASCWATVKSFVWRFCNLFLQDILIEDTQTNMAVIDYLVSNFTTIGLYDKVYGSCYDHIRTEQRSGRIAYERFGNQSIMFRQGWRLLYFRSTPMQQDNSNSFSNQEKRTLYLICLRGTFDVDRIVAKAIEQYNQVNWASDSATQSLRKRFFVKYIPDIYKDEDKKKEQNTTITNWQYHKTYRLLDRKPEEIGLGSNDDNSMLDRLFFPDEVVALIEEIKIWRKSREIYQQLGYPWKRGWLLHGPGGTGKTALASAYAHDLDMPIFVYNLAELTNMEFMREWKKMLSHTPCIALIEDIDNVFHGRKNISRGDDFSFNRMFGQIDKGPVKAKNSGGDAAKDTEGGEDEVSRRFGMSLNFDVLLNCLDGVDRCEGLFTIITTNHIEHIDPALGRPVERDDGTSDFVSTRPGRIDKAIELTYMLPYVKERMAKHLLGRFPDVYESFISEVRSNSKKETPAQFQERCAQLALKSFWEEHAAKQKAEEAKEATLPFLVHEASQDETTKLLQHSGA